MKLNNIQDFNFNLSTRVIVLLSGGMDSTVLLFWAKSKGIDVKALEFDYANRPTIEQRRTKAICQIAQVDLFSMSYPHVVQLETNSHSGFDSQTGEYNLLESNSTYYVLAANFGKVVGASFILGGQILPDWKNNDIGQSKPWFFNQLNRLLVKEYGSETPQIRMPFHYLSKKDVAYIGRKLNVPFELTWSCTNNVETPCNSCQACFERNDALREILPE